jgi:hypothetical protein
VSSAAYEHLAYFIGKWTTEGRMEATAFVPGGPFTSVDEASWLGDRAFVVVHANSVTPFGQQRQLSVLGYDGRRGTYTFNSFNGAGVATAAIGVVDGNVWTWTSEGAPGTPRVRHTITIRSDVTYDFVFETSPDGRTWSRFASGRVTKTE